MRNSCGGKTAKRVLFTRIFSGNTETRTFRYPKTEKPKSSGYSPIPNVLLQILNHILMSEVFKNYI